ncbi:MAG: hypothetical protein J7513_07070 [Solirubrobacteraceae bacterium]|nr:hypothetical protein [Solirubrobacteraceae bacterium]
MDVSTALRQLDKATSGKWHWWHYHFGSTAIGRPIPFALAFASAIVEIDGVMPGYAQRTIEAVGAVSGREKHRPDYEQLLQRLAEVHVALEMVRADWPAGTTFSDEPTAPGSQKNPEMVVSTPSARLGIEVKAPALLDHEAKRSTRPLQAGGRIHSPEKLVEMAGGKDKLTLPRDNPVKDFLVSADEKFAAFRQNDPDFYGVLAIVWDDFIYEPVTSLTHKSSGLLTPNSFWTDGHGQPVRFPNVDAVLLVSHLQFLKRSLGEDGGSNPFVIGGLTFKWDLDPARPVALLHTPHGRSLPPALAEPLNVRALEDLWGAEYHAPDTVQWITTLKPDE